MGDEAVLDAGQQQQGMKTKEFIVYLNMKNIKEGSDGTVTVEGYASTFAEDLDGETVAPDAFKGTLDDYMLNPIILANHKNGVEYVVGKTIDAKVDQNGLWVKVQLSNSDDDFTKMVRTKVKEGLLKAFSIGGLFKFDYPTIEKVKLLEISIVPIPANPYALFSLAKAFKHAIGKDNQGEQQNQEKGKTVSGDTSLPLANKGREWDSDAAVDRVRKWAGGPEKDKIDWDKYQKAFFWYNGQDANNYSGYKLPFADVVNGELKAVPNAIYAVAAALDGARGGVDIPSSAKSKIKNKVETYYSRIGETAPWNRDDSGKAYTMQTNSDEESWDIIEKDGIESDEGTEDAIVARFFDAEKADQFLNMLNADLDDGGNAKESGRDDDTDPRLGQQQGEADDDPGNSKEEGKQQDTEDPKALYAQALKALTDIYHQRRKHDHDFS